MMNLANWIMLVVAVSSSALTAQSPIKVTRMDQSHLPKSIVFEGAIKNAIKWNDQQGTHLLITSESGEHASGDKGDPDFQDADVYAYHYLTTADSLALTWKLHDLVANCPLDLEARYTKNTLKITDLNEDGNTEIWLMYTLACRGDVSPADMKIIMYEGKQKFAMRGKNKVKLSDTDTAGGEYQFDVAFNDAFPKFKSFAIKLWDEHIWQSWED